MSKHDRRFFDGDRVRRTVGLLVEEVRENSVMMVMTSMDPCRGLNRVFSGRARLRLRRSPTQVPRAIIMIASRPWSGMLVRYLPSMYLAQDP